MPGESFWQGFYKKAEVLAVAEKAMPRENDEVPPPIMQRSISKSGPVLSDLTMESDRGKFETFKG